MLAGAVWSVWRSDPWNGDRAADLRV